MSDSANVCTTQGAASRSCPGWIAGGILGLAAGLVGGALLLIYGYGFRSPEWSVRTSNIPGAGGGDAPPTMGMGGGMMMGMGGGPGGGANGKRSLTALVGKLELLSRPDLTLRVELNAEQTEKVAAELAALNEAEKLTDDDAQSRLEVLEALLTAEQKAAIEAIGLPRPGAGGPPGGAPGAGPPGAAPPMMGMGMPGGGGGMMGMGGGAPDENPFAQETNQKRLKDLLARLKPAAAETNDEAAAN